MVVPVSLMGWLLLHSVRVTSSDVSVQQPQTPVDHIKVATLMGVLASSPARPPLRSVRVISSDVSVQQPQIPVDHIKTATLTGVLVSSTE